ncbi:hypothetical protein [uncultured Jatrophihabitans sp.]|uniref:hypothetical protein n=1 Tax=uncultured Jatrophihabitans sp. TaxID=1610747 RepID=UPI0035CB4F18
MSTVYFPCEPIKVRVVTGLADSLSLVEQYIMRSVAAGAASERDLANMLALPHRVLIDAIGDLWRAGHLTIDFDTDSENIALSSSARELARSGRLDQVDSAFQSTGTRELLFDPITGRVLSPRARARPPRDGRLRLPGRASLADLAAISQPVLITAIDQLLRREEFEGVAPTSGRATVRTLNAYLEPSQLQSAGSSKPIYVAVEVRVSDGDLGLSVLVTEPSLSARQQAAATSYLQNLLDDAPTLGVAAALREQASHDPPPLPMPLEDLLDLLDKQAEQAACSQPGSRQQAHDLAARELARVNSAFAAATQGQATFTVLTDPPAHRTALVGLISSARTQLVLAAPWISHAGLRPLLEPIAEAVRKGVQLVLLWGMSPDQQLDARVLQAIQNLQRIANTPGAGQVLVRPDTPARSHAKVAVADDRRALVSSHNFLSSGEHQEVGLQVTAAAGLPCAAIDDLLAWAAHQMPDPEMAECVSRKIRAVQVTGETASGARIEPPRFRAALDPPTAPPADVQAWALAWRGAAKEARALAVGLAPAASVVLDSMHRHLADLAVRQCSRRLALVSDGLQGTILDAPLRAALVACAERGVEVTVVYGSPAADGDAAVATLEAEARNSGVHSKIAIRHVPDNHAKLLVWDDQAVVGSFNFLSFRGTDRRSAALRNRAELSLHVHSGELATRLLRSVAPDRAIAAAASAVLTHVEAPGTAVDGSASRLAQDILELVRPGQPSRSLAALVGSAQRPFAVLDALEAAGAPNVVLERAAAAALAGHSQPPEAARAWWLRLAQLLWQRQAFAEAAIARSAVDSPDDEPSPLVVKAAAAVDSEALCAQLEDAALGEAIPSADCTALAVLAAAWFTHHADYSLLDPMGVLAANATAPAQRLAAATAALSNTGRSLPTAALQARHARNADQAAILAQWKALTAALANLQLYNASFEVGKAILKHLRAHRGFLEQLADGATRRDTALLANLLREYSVGSAESWVDHLSSQLGIPHVMGRKRLGFVKQLDSVVAPTIFLVRAETQDVTEHIDTAAEECAREISASLDALDASLPSGSVPYSWPLLEHAKAALRVLVGDAAGQPTIAPGSEWAACYPRLAQVVMSDEAASPDEQARRLARDLADGLGPLEATADLVEAGEYRLADLVIDGLSATSSVSHAAAEEARRLLEDAVRMSAAAASRRCHDQNRRAVAVGVLELPRAELVELARDRRAGADHQLQDQLAEIQIAERAAKVEILGGLAAAARPQGDPWHRQVTELVTLGELAAARRVLTSDPEHFTVELPQPSAEAGWPFRELSLRRAADMFTDTEQRPAGLTPFLPAADDSDAAGLVAALGALASEESGSSEAWLSAVANLVGDTQQRPPITPRLLSLDGPAWPLNSLARRTLVMHTAVPGTARDDGVPEQALAESAHTWEVELSTDLLMAKRGRQVTISVSDVLGLLPLADAERPLRRRLRQQRFLRLVCRQLDPAAVVAVGDFGDPGRVPLQVWWLLYLLGFAPSHAQVYALSEFAGEHPDLLRLAIVREARRARAENTEFEFAVTLSDLGFAAEVAASVRDQVGLPAATALFASLPLGSVSSAADLQVALELSDYAQLAELAVSDEAVAEYARQLIQHGFATEGAGNEMQLCSCGAMRLLQGSHVDIGSLVSIR